MATGNFVLGTLLVGFQILGVSCVLLRPSLVRKSIAAFSVIGASLMAGLIFGTRFNVFSIVIALCSLAQLLNILRIIENRLQTQNLRRRIVSAGLPFIALTVLAFTGWLYASSDIPYLLYVIYAVVCLAWSAVVLATTLSTLKRGTFKAFMSHYSDAELPTVSVLVPARNEDAALTDCIHSILDSNYPKLEIIVLDDCSHDSSSDIIKRFAHQGVRFIQGENPKEEWLAKNQAYETLASAASGDWLVFSGVDVRFSKDTVRTLITGVLNEKLLMTSILPERATAKQLHLISPLRYFWETSIPKILRAHKRPGVLSTFWLIQRQAFKEAGGFSAVSGSVSPEGFFAKKTTPGYRFLISGSGLHVSTGKPLKDQYETAVRTLYPELRRRLERVLASSIALVLFMFVPFVSLFTTVVKGEPLLAGLFGTACAALLASHGLVSWHAGQVGILRVLNFPYLVLQETGLLFVSMFAYEFSEVSWKGRNICYPVMKMAPRLPEIGMTATRKD